MEIHNLQIPGSFEITTKIFEDQRGIFCETFRFDELEKSIGHKFDLRQMNTSVSKMGTLRGIHFAKVPRGQAKYVTVPFGKILDFVVDVRLGSATFGKWVSVEISAEKRNAVYLSEGLGHAFLSLQDDTVVSYLVSDIYRPEFEFAINPLDKEICLDFPIPVENIIISDKDLNAPTLHEYKNFGELPQLDQVEKYLNSLKEMSQL